MSGSGTVYVLGGSLAGLLSAAVLAERFDRVVVLERDQVPDGVRARRGVPQSRHLHALLSRGLTTLEELLPGFLAEMVHAGAVTGDLMRDVQWFVDGRPVSRRPAGIIGLSASRPLLEWMVRRRVAELPGVVIVPGCVVDGLLTTPDRRRVVGVRALADGQLREWTGADLVVDATGRATLSPRWLAELGFSVPVESQQIRLAYASRPYRRHGQDLGGRLGTASWAYPGHPYGGFVFAEEGDRCIMMVAAYSGGPLNIDDAGLLNVTQQLPTDVLSQLVRTGRPLGPAALMRFPAERRHRFDRAGRLPAGFLPIGDAICSFNPSYGQGMTVAAMEARLLRELLGGADLPERFLAESASIIDVPWQLATGNDRRFEPGYDPATDPMAPLRAGVSRDPELALAFLRVAQLIDPPSRFSDPDIVARSRSRY